MDTSWEERNNAYLAAELSIVRKRLREFAEAIPPSVRIEPREVMEAANTRPVVEGRRWWPRRRNPATSAFRSHSTVSPPLGQLAESGEPTRGEERPWNEFPPALVALSARLALTSFERNVLLLAAAVELDPAVAELCAAAEILDGRPTPSFALALQIFDDPEWEALAPHRPLRRLQLVTLVGASQSVVHARLRADERVVNLIKGLDHLDGRLIDLLVPMAASPRDWPVAPSHEAIIKRILRRVQAAGGDRLLVSLAGPTSVNKRIIAQAVAGEIGAFVVRLPVTNMPPAGADLNAFVRLWERDSLLSPVVLYLDAFDPDSGELGREMVVAARRLLSRLSGLVFVDSREAWSSVDGAVLVVDVANPTAAEQEAEWEAVLPASRAPLARELAGHFDLDPITVRELAFGAAADPSTPLWEDVRTSQRPNLDLLGRRARTTIAADELVLPDDILEQLERIKEQVRHRSRVYNEWGLAQRISRGLGISALFAGESGTGKTLAAEVMASDLDLDLYRIDLSGVVSKYIGETEKNLRRVFDAAERGGTILCFEEADALFGKRSEVKDSHDRYANIEVNYLLQRMEEYRGLAILTTNMKAALDQAFRRRIRFVIDFPFPGQVEREEIWRRSFVEAVAADALDFERLARITLSGGSIHDVAVNAMFAAAASNGVVTMPMVLAAARTELRKIGMPLNESELLWEPAMESGVAS